MLILGFLGIQKIHPVHHAVGHLLGIPLSKLDFRPQTDVVLGFLQQFEQGGDRLAIDLLRHHQWAALVGDPIEAAVRVIAVRVAQVMLEVADEHLRPIHEIERAIRRHGDARWAEIRVLRDIRSDEVLDSLALDAGTLLSQLGAENSLHTDHVGVEEKPLPIVREVAAGEDRRAGARARRAIPELFHRGMRAGVEVAAHGRAEVVVIAGGVGDQVISPIVENPAVRIGEAVRRVAHEFAG